MLCSTMDMHISGLNFGFNEMKAFHTRMLLQIVSHHGFTFELKLIYYHHLCIKQLLPINTQLLFSAWFLDASSCKHTYMFNNQPLWYVCISPLQQQKLVQHLDISNELSEVMGKNDFQPYLVAEYLRRNESVLSINYIGATKPTIQTSAACCVVSNIDKPHN